MSGPPQPGEELGDFQLESVIGRGGMGVVYKARQRSLGRLVALKLIREDIADLSDYRERFLREARLAACVEHENVVTVFHCGAQDERLYLAMQWIDGEDLGSVLERRGALAPERAVAIVTQIARALDAVHARGLVHRDVKPANVLLGQLEGRERAYLTDFGIARPAQEEQGLTKAGLVAGTAGYVSPEQTRGAEPGPRSDLYALGCVLFEALTGRAPFLAEQEAAVRWAHATEPRPLASAVLPDLGERYDGFLGVALAVDPERRFGSGRELAEALERVHAGVGWQAAGTALGGKAATVAAPTHPPTAFDPLTPMPPHAQPSPPGVPYGYATPTPPPAQHGSSGNPLALVLLALVALAGLAVGALAAAGVFSHGSASQRPAGQSAAQRAALARSSSSTHSTSTHTVAVKTQVRTTLTTSTVTVQAPAQPVAQEGSAVPFEDGFPGAEPTGRDSRGFNIGPGCSDDPASPLPGCSDAPSIPSGDAVGTCPNNLTIDRLTTSCGLAENVYANYAGDGPVSALSPERGRYYTFECRTAGAGTTGYRFCLGQAGEAVLYVRWLP